MQYRGKRRTAPGSFDVWPAFTDVLGSVLVVLVFLITVFVINEVLIGREMSSQVTTIDQLKRITDYLDNLLGEANDENATLEREVVRLSATAERQRSRLQQLGDELAAANAARAALDDALQRERLHGQLLSEQIALRDDAYATLEGQKRASDREVARIEQEAALLSARADRLGSELERLNRALADGQEALARNDEQLAAAQEERQRLETTLSEKDQALETSLATIASQDERLAAMDRLIKRQLVERVEELERYASDFFGRLREVFADNPDIKIVGDRFVFQSEVLFPSAAAELSAAGKGDLDKFIAVYRQIADRLPDDLPVLIEVQGHTDHLPIRNEQFRSNWELSSARALGVVDYLIQQGIPPRRLAAVGMGEHHPIESGTGPESLRRNRRIELKITSR